jgi:hypothetical protein
LWHLLSSTLGRDSNSGSWSLWEPYMVGLRGMTFKIVFTIVYEYNRNANNDKMVHRRCPPDESCQFIMRVTWPWIILSVALWECQVLCTLNEWSHCRLHNMLHLWCLPSSGNQMWLQRLSVVGFITIYAISAYNN